MTAGKAVVQVAEDQKEQEQSHTATVVGKRIRHYRLQKGLTQTELGHRIGVDRTRISHLETRDLYPSLEQMDRLAEALGVTTHELHEPFNDVAARADIARSALEASQAAERAARELSRFAGSQSSNVTIERNVPTPVSKPGTGINQQIVVPHSWIVGIDLHEVYAMRVIDKSFEHHHILPGDIVIVHRMAPRVSDDDLMAVHVSGEVTLKTRSELSTIPFGDIITAGRVLGVLRVPRASTRQ